MSKHKHYFLRGLQASGKSTFAKELLDKYPNVYIRVNKDDLRNAYFKNNYSKDNERFILQVEEQIIRNVVALGRFVIWDNTHFAPFHTERKEKLEQELGIKFEVKDFIIPLEEAIMRDKLRPNPVGEKVIRETYKRYLNSDNFETRYPKYVEWDIRLPSAFIFDMDGTLAWNTTNRSWYDYSRVIEDSPNAPVCSLYELLSSRFEIIVVSGREDSCREMTLEWFRKNGLWTPNLIFMRKIGDSRKDDIIKKEIYEEHIKGKFNIRGVFDDRLSVCKMWHEIGLPLFRVGNPEADF